MRGRAHWIGSIGLALCACSAPRSGGDARASVEPVALTCEALGEPLGLDVAAPRLAWQLRACDPEARGLGQTGFRVLVASTPEALAQSVGGFWDSGDVASSAQAVEYGGVPLPSFRDAWWNVRVRDRDGRWSAPSAAGHWCTGPLACADWNARWIGPAEAERAWHLDGAQWIAGGAPLRRAFRVDGEREVVSAELLACAAEPLEVYLDGVRVGALAGGPEPVVLDLTSRLPTGAHVLACRAGAHGFLARLRVFFREGTDLRLASDASWRVAPDGDASWSAVSCDDSHWPAAAIVSAPSPEYEAALRDVGPLPDPWLRKTFELDADVRRATVWVASLGYHELHANGAKVGDAVLAPGLSDLAQRARWSAYDLTPHLHRGKNALGLWLSAGWARYERFRVARAPLALLCGEIELADGGRLRLASDGSWRTRASPSTHLGGWGFGDFGGERWDARLALPGWCDAELDDSSWEPARESDVTLALSAKHGEPDRAIETLEPVAIEELAPDAFRIDMGRVYTGFLEAALVGEPDATVTLTWSERAEDETTYSQKSACVLDAHGRVTFRNRFDYAVGRWITLRGPIRRPSLGDVHGELVRSGYARAAEFACSDELLNRIHDTLVWTFECLSQGGVVADCAHRERLGYGGDAHATLGTGLAHFALAPFYEDWLADWRDAQGADGGLPYTAPTYGGGGGPAWSGIVAYLPWELYVTSGDRRALAESYPTARRWLEFACAHVRDGLLQPYGDPVWGFLGDWVPPGRGQGPGERVDERSTLFFNNAYLALCLERAARVAGVLGRADEAGEWRRRADELRATLHERFFDAEQASYANGEQPYLALALLAHVVPDELRTAVLARLEQEIRAKDGHVDAGIHGTAFLIRALMEAERPDLVYELARQTTYPSWGHMLAEGATTSWEQWDGVHSRTHSSFLSLGEWFVRGLAGLRPDPDHPGYEHVIVRPAPVGDLTWARARFDSVRGRIAVRWSRDAERFTLAVELPPGTTATVFLPTDDARAVRESGRDVREARGVSPRHAGGGLASFDCESGRYEFTAPLRRRSER